MRVFPRSIKLPLDVSVQCSQEANTRHHGRAVEFDDQEQGFDRGLPLLEILLGLGKLLDIVRGVFEVTSWRPWGRGMGSSKTRDQSAMMQPGRANVGAAMIAHGAEHRVAHSNLEIIIVASPGSFFLFGLRCYEFRANFFAVDPGEFATTVC
jgi:hypothetical protein